MILEALALLAACGATDPFISPGYDIPNSGTRQIATPRPYPANVADSVHRPGFNGRLWVGNVVMGGVDLPPAPDQGSPGPASYGAHPGGREQVYVRVGQLVVAINPWQEWNTNTHARFEAARQEWLAEHNYTGGVRTFMNDAALVTEHHGAHADADVAPETSPRAIRPRAIIELAPDAPRIRHRMRVQAPNVIRVLPALPEGAGGRLADATGG